MPLINNKMIISWRTLGLSLLLAVVVGLSSIGEPIDRVYDAAVGRVAYRPVSGDIVVVGVDDRSVARSPDGRFSRTDAAALIDAINKAGPRRLFVDFDYQRREGDTGLAQVAAAARRMGDRVVLAVSTRSAPGKDQLVTHFPDPAFGDQARRASIAWEYEFWQVWRVPLMYETEGRLLPSFAAVLAGKSADSPASFRIDLTYDPRTIREYSAVDVIEGKVGARDLAGKDVIFGPPASVLDDRHYLPGTRSWPGR